MSSSEVCGDRPGDLWADENRRAMGVDVGPPDSIVRLPRAECPRCGRDVALRVGGELREHRPPRIGPKGERLHPTLCHASGMTPQAYRNAYQRSRQDVR